ncbi:MAG: DUF2723 domain-containing protein [Paraprevotella sp.]|nr:DUF2723 domain-containing protein [Paraprevotella sp.]
MKQFKLVNNLVGWITFAIAAWVYCSTIEPTASFWDCPEFITTGYKLEVGHPPGAPFFMLTANLFSQFASDPSQVARMVNTMSALMSGGCILFLFWSITHLTRKLICKDYSQMTTAKLIAIEGSGLVGALVYTFSDTFWFSAVEGEVYAYSSLFTALVFWLILKWDDHADEPHSDRWLVLISYLTGLSIGVHLLNLLCLPAIVLIWYYKKHPDANLKGSILALIASFILVTAVLYGIVPGIVKVGGWFELFFVNTLGLPFNTGLIFYIFCLIIVVLWAIRETIVQKNRRRMNISFLLSVAMLGIPFYGYGWSSFIIGIIVLAVLAFVINRKVLGKPLVSPRVLNTSLLCMLMIMIGYSSYSLIVIRSTANPPMDQNSPEDIFTLGQYLSREQYGSRPLFYGQAYTSKVKYEPTGDGYYAPKYKEGAPVYQRVEKHYANEKDAYRIVYYDKELEYAQNMLFPRMYSDRADHVQAYEDWMGGVKGKQVPYDQYGQTVMVKMPTQAENLYLFLSYQINFMYFRYFLWNFAGRQNDIQGNGELEKGNWLTGIPFIDNARLGDQSKLPTELKNNKGHNVFYCLPLILGLIGLFWQAYKNQEGVKQFWVVFFLFFMTGIAIVIYLNQTPLQPRERDYAYAGSFYAFAIWVGMGVAAIIDFLKRFRTAELPAAILVSLLALLVPIQMAGQTWDDHDRSHRYTCRDFGQNYLNSMDDKGNPVIFTNGDNDTFPLWYNQETEGVRTDARVCNLSYLQTDWYIDQMKRPAYDSPSLPISWTRLQYVTGTREGIPVQPDALKQVMDYYKDQPEELKKLLGDNPYELKNIIQHWILNDNTDLQIFPTDSIVITVDKEAVKRSGMMIAADSIPDVMHISLKGKRAVYKNEMMMLEMLSQANWERPLYMSTTVGADNYGHLGDNFVQEGLASRITPFDTKKSGRTVDSERMYNNMMNKFKYGGLKKYPDVYLDETVMRMCYTHRRLFSQLAKQLLAEGKKDKALKVVTRAEQEIPASVVPHDYMGSSIDLAEVWLKLGHKAEGEKIIDAVGKNAKEYLEWYLSLSTPRLLQYSRDCMINLYVLDDIARTLAPSDKKKADEYRMTTNNYASRCQQRGVNLQSL